MQFETIIKFICSDNGQEFEMDAFYNSLGIEHKKSCVEMPEQNGVVEQKHQYILCIARALRFQAKLTEIFWTNCITHAVYIINRLASPVIGGKTPFEILYRKAPDYSMLKVFGCLAFACTLARGRKKFCSRARHCIFLGFQRGIKGYKLYDLETHKIFISRDVSLQESVFPFSVTTMNFCAPEQCVLLPVDGASSLFGNFVPRSFPSTSTNNQSVGLNNHNFGNYTPYHMMDKKAQTKRRVMIVTNRSVSHPRSMVIWIDLRRVLQAIFSSLIPQTMLNSYLASLYQTWNWFLTQSNLHHLAILYQPHRQFLTLIQDNNLLFYEGQVDIVYLQATLRTVIVVY